MLLKVLLFGIATDFIGASSIDFEISENSTVLNFKESLQKQYPNLSQLNSFAIAVNESYARDDTLLKENDIIAVIPPVSGG